MKTFTLTLFSFCIMALGMSQDTLAYWSMNETSGNTIKESITGTSFSIYTQWPITERMNGVKQKAIRTDGYTTWIEGNQEFNFPLDSFSFSAWYAPEVYPNATASIWSYFDVLNNRGSYISVNKFGQLEVRITINSQPLVFTSVDRIEHWKWNFIVVNINGVSGSCLAYINGVEIINQRFASGTLTWSATKTLLGRGVTNEKQGIFPLNFLNGLIDEVIIRKSLRSTEQILVEYNSSNPLSAPDMTTPASRFAEDFHRPKYHAIPKSAWGNESHGLIYYNNNYHIFYQKNGNAPTLNQQNWGHLVSPDLLHWIETKPALFPQPGWESVGCWSGHIIQDQTGLPTIIYTGVDGIKAGVGSAQSSGDLLNWNRHPSNPLLDSAPTIYLNKDFRDPYVFKEGTIWYMIIGSGLQKPQTGTVFLYKSANLVSWQLLGTMFYDQSFLNDPGQFWEMPVFWKFGNTYMLLVNKVPEPGTPAKAFYWTGSFENESFFVKNPRSKNLEVINSLLSPSVAQDSEGRVTAIGIIPDLVNATEHYKKGWANVFSLPRVWQLVNDTLHQSPHPSLEQTRGAYTNFSNLMIKPESSNNISIRGWQLELKGTIVPGTASQVGFLLGKNENATEFTKIYYDYVSQKVIVDRTASSTNTNVTRDIQAETLHLKADQPIEWHIFIDGSVIEVFINNRWAFATRIFPSNFNSNGIDVFSTGGIATLSNLQVWQRGDIVTGVLDVSGSNTVLKAYPLPASDRCSIQLPQPSYGIAYVYIYDINGREISRIQQRISTEKNIITWDLKTYAGVKVKEGSYFALIAIDNKKFYRARMIVGK